MPPSPRDRCPCLRPEAWAALADYPGYWASSCGRVWSDRTRRLLTGKKCRGWSAVHLVCLDGEPRYRYVHQLVAQAFVPGRTQRDWSVNHKDGDKTNNHKVNLEWTSHQGQSEHAKAAGLKARGSRVATSKLDERAVLDLVADLRAGLHRQEELGRRYGLSQAQVSAVATGRSWTHVTGVRLEAREAVTADRAPPAQVLDGDVERWLPVQECPAYFISSRGRVWSSKTSKLLQTSRPNHGGRYVAINLSTATGSRTRTVHQLVAMAFLVRQSPAHETVNHKDGDGMNNHWANLEWLSDAENQAHATRTGLHQRRLAS